MWEKENSSNWILISYFKIDKEIKFVLFSYTHIKMLYYKSNILLSNQINFIWVKYVFGPLTFGEFWN